MKEDQYAKEEWLAFLTGLDASDDELDKLIKNQQQADEFFENLEANLASDFAVSLDVSLPAGYRIGKYEITNEIGKGGMAHVYKAKRIDNLFEQNVAIKLLSPVLTTDQYEHYFNSERKLLASLNHSNIAKIFDGGVTDEIPYFIMEYIEGVPIHEYCRKHDLATTQIIKLVIQVCLAVEHAHTNFILHRDIKPSNILISSDGNIKLLDFGIGKFLNNEFPDDESSFRGTIRYASPEQLSRETLTTRSDIYQVGVLLYELLTGTAPFRGADRSEVTHAIQKGKFQEAKRQNSRISKDLNAIISRCMALKPSDRYPSLTAVIGDLNNYLTSYPVSARDASWQHSAGLFLNRNKITTALITLIVLISMGAAVLTRIQMAKTEREQKKVLAANRFLTRIFEANDPNLVQGEEVSAAMLLKKSEKEIDHIQDPEIKAFTQSQLGSLYESIGLWEKSGPLFLNALDNYLKSNPEDHHPDIANAYNNIAGYYRNISEFDKADSTLRMAIAMLEDNQEEYPVTLATSYQDHAYLFYQMGRYKEGEQQVRQAINLIQQAIDRDRPKEKYAQKKEIELAFAYNTLSSLLREQSRYDEALEASKKAVKIGKRYADENISVKLIPLNNLALAYNRLGLYDKEIAILSKELKEETAIYGPDHPETVKSLANLGAAHYKAGNLLKADSLNQLAYEAYLEKFGPFHHYTTSTLYNLANSKYSQQQFDEAQSYFIKVLDADLENFGEEHPYVAGDFVSLGLVQEGLNNYSAAEKYYKKAFKIYYKKFGEQHQKISYVHSLLGSFYGVTGDLNKAEHHYKKAIEISKEVLGKDHQYYQEYVNEWDELKASAGVAQK